MRVGTQFSQPAFDLPPREALASYTTLVETAAQAGFSSFWAGQHFLPGDYQLFQPLPLLARLSAHAPSLTLGTSVILLPLLNPLDVAEQAAAIDAMAGGGFRLGVGLGYRRLEFDAAGVRRDEADARFEEAIDLIRLLWSGEEVTFHGRFYRVARGRMNPSLPSAPVYVGAYAERSVQRAGRLGDAWLVPPELAGEALSRRIELYRSAASAASRTPRMILMRPFHVTRDPAEARRVRELLVTHFARKRSWGLHKGEDASDPATDAAGGAIVGTPEECVEAVERYRADVAPEELILLMGFRGTDDRTIRQALELAGEAVMPALG